MRRTIRILATMLLALAAVPALAQGRAHNTLSAKEVEAGWILLFDGETRFGWAPRGPAKWAVADGTLTPVAGTGKGFLATTTEFPNYRLKAEFWVDDVANSGVFLRCPTTGEINSRNAYEVNIYDRHAQWPTGSINDVIRTRESPQTAGHWNSYDITADGTRLVVRLNGATVVNTRDSRHARGTLGLQYNGEGEVAFRDIKLQPLGLKSIFNGKDLTGWKEVPGHASVYRVTPEGTLNVKNGNGDLQSTTAYGDFVFQLDVISNGEHLNSGVFFRTEPGQFWAGYEAQIRNQWVGNDRSRPVDYGTGAIYNRQAARRVISSDYAWFTMTIAAHGNHMATWVDGVQVTDFTDTRPANPNARNGYRAKAGVLGLQGHDPTTDLSFRNLRIAEMPAP
jgi:hypothetical protein